ncbi:MAG TPA: ABC transporter permease [Bacteroidota bacterium]|nr:ABC transporter permease [Bacteroidota bacterium]
MKIPFSYTWRSLWTRKLTTVLTLGGIALVVFVFASVLMLSHGVEQTMVDTGSDDNAMAFRRSANSELVSQIDRDAANIIKSAPEIALGPDGKPVVSTEIVVIINLHKKGSNDMGNISVRGVSPAAMTLRPQVQIVSGQMFHFGSREVILGSNIAKQFQGTGIGSQLRFGDAYWTVVGYFDAGGTGFDSEIWGDVEQMMPAFGRPVFSSVTMHLKSSSDYDALKARIEKDPRTQYTEIKHEKVYYREQSALMSDFIKIMGLLVTIIFSIGAMIGAMITMYAAVANRTVEIGTMRAIGFRRRSILGAFLVESVILSFIGGCAGIALASLMSLVRISTVNFGTFSELAFGFTLSPQIVVSAMVFSVVMGIVGGFLPAARAARMNILEALRSA